MKDIKELILTVFELNKVLTFLDQFDQIIYKPEIDVKNFISQYFTGEEFDAISQRLLGGGLNVDTLFSQSKMLSEELRGLPVVTLTLPMVVEQQMATSICLKARQITGTPVVIDLKHDASIIGGAVVEGNGRVGEYSFRRYFSQK